MVVGLLCTRSLLTLTFTSRCFSCHIPPAAVSHLWTTSAIQSSALPSVCFRVCLSLIALKLPLKRIQTANVCVMCSWEDIFKMWGNFCADHTSTRGLFRVRTSWWEMCFSAVRYIYVFVSMNMCSCQLYSSCLHIRLPICYFPMSSSVCPDVCVHMTSQPKHSGTANLIWGRKHISGLCTKQLDRKQDSNDLKGRTNQQAWKSNKQQQWGGSLKNISDGLFPSSFCLCFYLLTNSLYESPSTRWNTLQWRHRQKIVH